MKLLMRSTEDGFTAEKFHRLCDNMGPTLTVVKSNNSEFGEDQIFGGFTTLSWQSPSINQDMPDKRAFLFSLDHETIHPIKQSQSAISYRKD